MLGSLAYYLTRLGAPAVLFIGVWVALFNAAQVRHEYGTPWGIATFVAIVLACTLAAWALFRLSNFLAANLGPAMGRGPRDRLFCQRCGGPVRPDDVVCLQCGGTKFAVTRPASQ